MKKILALTSILLLAASLSYAQGSSTGTTTLNLTVGNEAGITVNTTTAFSSSTTFADYTATTGFTYFIRTGTSAGNAGITLKVTTDFSTGGANGGPSVANPPTATDALTYTCSASGPAAGTATPCATAQTASTTSTTSVVTFGANTQSAKTGNTGSVAWNLTNDPNYKAGVYNNAVVTFTISAS